jgi:predicted aspartyl protease
MIYGKVINGMVIIPVLFRLPSQPDFSLDLV